MPPKSLSSKTHVITSDNSRPTPQQLEAINKYLAQKPDFDRIIAEAKATSNPQPQSSESAYEAKIRQAVRETIEERHREAHASSTQGEIMPHHPKEEHTSDNIYDKVAKESNDSNASDHPMHHTGEASHEAHKANPGPVIFKEMPEAASKEELKKRSEELNKKD